MIEPMLCRFVPAATALLIELSTGRAHRRTTRGAECLQVGGTNRMTTSTLLTILGIVVTVALGAWGLYLTVAQRYPGRITFVKEGCIGIFDSIVRNLPELSVSYEDKPVSENLVLLKGFLLNTGSKDITPTMAEKSLTIDLPEDFRWLTAKIVSTSPSVRASAQCAAQRLYFEMGLFRRGEHIRFEALAEVPAQTDRGDSSLGEILEQALTFHHRIADTRKVDRQELPTTSQRKRRKYRSILMGTQLLVLAVLVVFATWFDTGRAEIQYSLVRSDSSVVDVTVRPKLNGTLELRGAQDEFREVLPIKSFYFDRKWAPKVIARRLDNLTILLVAFSAMIAIAFLFGSAAEWRRIKRLTKLLALR